MFKSIENTATAEIVEKKSKFIANIYSVDNKEEIQRLLEESHKKYYDANHNCYAYILENEEKYSDDGEPTGTSGAPMLSLLKNSNLKNILVVVTRYFGGILLGTGGLVRAYTKACKTALENADIVYKENGIRYEIEISYSDFGMLQHICENSNIEIKKVDYSQDIKVVLDSTKEDKNYLINNINVKKICIKEEKVVIKLKNIQ